MLTEAERTLFNSYLSTFGRWLAAGRVEDHTTVQQSIERTTTNGALPIYAANFLHYLCGGIEARLADPEYREANSYSLEDYMLRQIRIYFDKLEHGRNTADLSLEHGLLQWGVDNVKHALDEGKTANIVEELANVVIRCYGIAAILNTPLDAAIFERMSREDYCTCNKTENN